MTSTPEKSPSTSASGGIRIESVSLGKGYVAWRIQYPPLVRRRRELKAEYPKLAEACEAVQRWCRRDECDPQTAALVEKNAPEGEWASGRQRSDSSRVQLDPKSAR